MSKFWRSILPPSSGRKMEAVHSVETMVPTYQSERYQNPRDHSLEELQSLQTYSSPGIIGMIRSARHVAHMEEN
jgi:hypothetical protein